MATDQSYIEYLLDQLSEIGDVSARKMFGEYALYCGGKVVALVCDNQLFVKPTESGRTYIGPENIVEAPAYPGAKPSFLIVDEVDDQSWLVELIQVTTAALPMPKPKPVKKSK